MGSEKSATGKPYFATCAKGVEPVLADELHGIGAADVKPGRGGVRFSGDLALLYRANLWLRTAIRVLRPILEATVTSPDELYEAVRSLDWSRYMTPDHTLAVDCNVRDSHITHSKYAALRVKDAICDQFVERVGRRPSVNVERTDGRLEPAHLPRSSRAEPGKLRRIAAQARLSADPHQGAAQRSAGGGAGPADRLARRNALCRSVMRLRHAAHRGGVDGAATAAGPDAQAFRLPGLDGLRRALWTALRDEARRGVRRALPAPILGSDVRGDAVAFAIDNARAAGIGHLLRFDKRDMRDFRPPEGPPGVILCNPPYGERIGEEKDLISLYKLLGEVFAQALRRLDGVCVHRQSDAGGCNWLTAISTNTAIQWEDCMSPTAV